MAVLSEKSRRVQAQFPCRLCGEPVTPDTAAPGCAWLLRAPYPAVAPGLVEVWEQCHGAHVVCERVELTVLARFVELARQMAEATGVLDEAREQGEEHARETVCDWYVPGR